jgi:phage portal protein BeeE
MAGLFGRRTHQRARVTDLAARLEQRLAELDAGNLYSVTTVRSLPAVVAARALIADVAAAMPVVGVRDGRVITPTPSILLRPDVSDPAMTRRRWVHRSAMSLTGWGQLYLGVTQVAANDWPLSATVLHPDYLSPEYAEDGRTIIGWRYNGSTVLQWVVYVPLWELDLVSSPSPLAACQQAFDDLALLWGFATAYWREGGLPPYVLKNGGRLNATQAADALEQWVTARRQRRPGVLTGTWELSNLGMPSASDALLLDGLAYIDANVARIYGIPPTLLNTKVETGSLTYSNSQEELRRWLNLSLYPTWLARIEDAMTAMLPRGQQAMFDTTYLGGLGMSRPGADEGRATANPVPPTPAALTNGNTP